MKTARKTSDTRVDLTVVNAPVTLYKTTGETRSKKWETRLVDAATGLPPEDTEPQKQTASVGALDVAVQGDPLGAAEDYNDRATEALEEKEDAERAWNPPADPAPSAGPALIRQRGFETERGFVAAEEQLDEIAAVTALESMKIVGFIRPEGYHKARIRESYYVAPEKGNQDSRRVLEMLREALLSKGRVAVVKWTKSARSSSQSLGVLAPGLEQGGKARVLYLIELAWADDLRSAPQGADLSPSIVTRGEVDACEDLIDAMKEPRATMDEMRDDAAVLREELRELAEGGHVEEFTLPSTDVGVSEDVPLEDALRFAAGHAEEFVANV